VLVLEGKDLVRIAIIGGVIGLGAFCASYGMLFWRKRNNRSDHHPLAYDSQATFAYSLVQSDFLVRGLSTS